MATYKNEKGETVEIETMSNNRLIHAIAKYTMLESKRGNPDPTKAPVVVALKNEALKRLTEIKPDQDNG